MMRPVLRVLALFGFSTAAGTLHAGPTPRLVRDFNRGPGDHNAEISWVMPVESGAVFPMRTLAHGNELWFSNGTAKGTRLLADLVPGPSSSRPQEPRLVGNKVGFITPDGGGRSRLWFTDGTPAGTLMMLDTAEVPDSNGDIEPLLGIDTGLFFQITYEMPAYRQELWFSDGTVEGTRSLSAELPGLPDDGFLYPQESGGLCYFIDGSDGLWRSDGTAEGTVKVMDASVATAGGGLRGFAVAERNLYLRIGRGEEIEELWTASLLGAEPQRLGTETWRYITEMRSSGNELTLVLYDEDYRLKLWRSDGTPQGTLALPMEHRRTEFYPGGELVEWRGDIYFGGYSESAGPALWRTDGSPQGTRRVTSPRRYHPLGGPVLFAESGGSLYFHAQRSDKGTWELWRTNGSAKGTQRVSSLGNHSVFNVSGPLTAAWQDRLFFTADGNTVANALWITRPNGRGVDRLTVPEKTTGSAFGTLTSHPYEELDGDVLVLPQLPQNGYAMELWRINDSGRARALWSPRGLQSGDDGISFHGKAGGKPVFARQAMGEELSEVWATDGTAKGTRLLVRHETYVRPEGFVTVGNRLFYVAIDHVSLVSRLWVTDGSAEGTGPVSAWDFTLPRPLAGEMVAFQGQLYFMAREGTNGIALWRSDGTSAGTVRVMPFPNAGVNGGAMNLAVVGDRLVFAVNSIYYQTLWTSDGTEAGTRSISSPSLSFLKGGIGISVDLGGLHLFAARGSHGAPLQWYRSDGTAEGSYPLLPGQIGDQLFPIGQADGEVAVAGGLMFYRGRTNSGSGDSADGELWVTDGTAAGTRQVKDINPGAKSSHPSGFRAVGDLVYFTAEAQEHGRELWLSDGTEAGTRLVADLEPGTLGSHPMNLKAMNGKLYFTAEPTVTGRELYVLEE